MGLRRDYGRNIEFETHTGISCAALLLGILYFYEDYSDTGSLKETQICGSNFLMRCQIQIQFIVRRRLKTKSDILGLKLALFITHSG